MSFGDCPYCSVSRPLEYKSDRTLFIEYMERLDKRLRKIEVLLEHTIVIEPPLTKKRRTR